MVVDGMKMDAVAESGRNPSSKNQFQPYCGECPGLTRDGTAELSRDTKFSGANGDKEKNVFPDQLTTSGINNLTRLIHTLLKVLTIT